MIEVSELTKRFGKVQALDGVSFRVEPGVTYGLLGLNGAGKTTCLRIVATVLTPDAGSVRVLGLDTVREGLAARRRMGIVSSDVRLPPRFTPRELAARTAEIFGLRRFASRFDELVASLRMEDYLDRMLGTFSTGMKQKTQLLLAFLHDAEVMLLDEPTAGLDIPSARTVRDFLRRALARERSVLVCSHHLHEVEALCQQVGILHQGRLLTGGCLHDLKARHGAATLEDVFLKVTALFEPEAAVAAAAKKGEVPV